ncbi:RNA polymerase sigma factor [Chloroflexota bacterium]
MQFEDNEERLIEAAKSGDPDAFGNLYQLYFERIYRYVRSLLREHSDAEDVTAEVFIKVMRALPRYSEKGHFSAWLFRIARNETFNYIKRRKGQREIPLLENITTQGNLETEIEERMLLEKTFQAMHNLTDLQREVLSLRFGEDLSIKETAELMKRSIQAVKFLQVSALRGLRRQLRTDEDINTL